MPNQQTEYQQVSAALTTLINDLAPGLSKQAQLIIKRLVHSMSQQHSCLQIQQNDQDAIAELLASPIASTGEVVTPLIIRGSQLYFHRYYRLERKIAERLSTLNQPAEIPGFSLPSLDQFFQAGTPFMMQKIAAYLATTRRLTIITGGPGTGKTSTVAKIISLIHHLQPALTFALAAPTGKAASRLNQALQQTWTENQFTYPSHLSSEVQTLHRLLGMSKDGGRPRYHQDRPLKFDILIIDEASMIDLTLMSNLLDALNTHTRLILLGDPGQLPSVETGNLLADLTRPFPGFSADTLEQLKLNFQAESQSPGKQSKLMDAVCELKHSFRFSQQQGIGKLARSIIKGDPEFPADSEQVEVNSLSTSTVEQVITPLSDYVRLLHQQIPLQRLFDELNCFKVLTPTREGPWGVISINGHIEKMLETLNLKQPGQSHYHGRAIMILTNDYVLGLFNGDIGLCVDQGKLTDLMQPASDDSRTPSMVACFPDGSGLKTVPLNRLPEHETCFTMTVHKSQGSEFEQVGLVLAKAESDISEHLQTRELLYTAVTRCRSKVSIFADPPTWEKAVQRQLGRSSGLAEFLAQADQQPDHKTSKLEAN